MALQRPQQLQGIPKGVGDDGGERLVHFIGAQSCQFAQRRHARDVCKFSLRFAVSPLALSQVLLGLFALSQSG